MSKPMLRLSGTEEDTGVYEVEIKKLVSLWRDSSNIIKIDGNDTPFSCSEVSSMRSIGGKNRAPYQFWPKNDGSAVVMKVRDSKNSVADESNKIRDGQLTINSDTNMSIGHFKFKIVFR